jgi:hypothetical protein
MGIRLPMMMVFGISRRGHNNMEAIVIIILGLSVLYLMYENIKQDKFNDTQSKLNQTNIEIHEIAHSWMVSINEILEDTAHIPVDIECIVKQLLKENTMPSTSNKQHKFMEAVAHNSKFAKKAGVPVKVGKDFAKADDKAGITKTHNGKQAKKTAKKPKSKKR